MQTLTRPKTKEIPYIKRAMMSANPSARELFLIMEEKRTNLALAIDLQSKQDILKTVKELSPHIAVLKTHIDMVNDFDIHLLLELQDMAKRGRFLIFEDRKFVDTGPVVEKQYEQGIYKIANWAHLVSAHPFAGPAVVERLRKAGLDLGRGLLLVSEMGSPGALEDDLTMKKTVAMAQDYKDFVIGFIGRRRISEEPSFIHFATGISLREGTGRSGAMAMTPKQAIQDMKNDLIVVGKAILQAQDRKKEAELYRTAGWQAYEERMK